MKTHCKHITCNVKALLMLLVVIGIDTVLLIVQIPVLLRLLLIQDKLKNA